MAEVEHDENLTLEVIIPENSTAGDKITIQGPNKEYVEFVTPNNVVPGDTVHVVVNHNEAECSPNSPSAEKENQNKPQGYGVAAVTTGVLVSAYVMGPLITGIAVMGIMVCAIQRDKQKKSTAVNNEQELEQLEEGRATNPEDSSSNPEAVASEDVRPLTREEKIAASLAQATDTVVDTVSRLDEKLGISANTLRAIAAVQEMDERNKVTETIATRVKTFDQQYHISESATHAVNVTVTTARDIEERCKITENVSFASDQVVSCVHEVDRRYDLSSRITTALVYGISTLREAIQSYMNRITNNSTPEATVVSVVEDGDMPDTSQVEVEEIKIAQEPLSNAETPLEV